MLVEFTTKEGSALYVNAQHVVAVYEDRHFGRPGVGQAAEYRDSRIVTTEGEFNVQEPLTDVARRIGEALTHDGGHDCRTD